MKRTVGRAMEDAFKGAKKERTGRGSSMWTKSRENIYSFLTFRPFSTKSEIAKAVGVSDKTAGWHLDKLVEKGFLASGEKRYHPTGFISSDDTDALMLLARESARKLFLSILKNPGMAVGEAAAQTGLSRSIVSTTSSDLQKMGLIIRVQNGRFSHLYPTELFQSRVDKYRKKAAAFADHVTRLIKQDGLFLEGTRKEDTFTAVLKEGASKYSLMINTNPYASVLRDPPKM